ncbi:MAG: MBL fold metallo-hydrolase RNA specificity domain-containing protein [Bryobacteraceae bacterium]
MKLIFWGAVQTVTGSMHELRVNGRRYLLDCGLYQGRRKEAWQRNTEFPFRPDSVDAVLLSHAHIDHSGNLPTLVRQGYAGPIHATEATVDLCDPMLRDSGHLHEKDAEYLNKRAERRRALNLHAPAERVEPLYTVADAEAVLPLFRPAPMRTRIAVGDGLSWEFYDAGHILGSAALFITLEENQKRIRLVFSGDVGRKNLPITRDPEPLPPADYLILESTYGARLHKPAEVVADKLANVINRTCARGGKVIVPAFAAGRAQQLVLLLHELADAGRIPSIPIFLDSPLAVEITQVFRKHAELYDQDTRRYVDQGQDPFQFPRLKLIKDVAESKALNDLRGPFVIISASGMCEAGRILHHLKNNIEDPRNTVLITGFQAADTLGRKLVDKLPEVSIFGEPMRLRAEVETLNELSGHADQQELLTWMKPIVPGLKRVFLVHGEPAQAEALARAIRERYDLQAVIPTRGQSFDLV